MILFFGYFTFNEKRKAHILKPIQASMILILLFGYLVTACTSTPPKPPAEFTSGQQVRVIIQKADNGDQVGNQVEALGGEIIHDLRILNALAAEVPASQIPKLMSTDGVRRVVLDSQVHDADVTTESVRDNFDARSYSNNDGTQTWSGDWTEINDNQNPKQGKVLIRRGILVLSGPEAGILRTVNLSLASWAELSFDVRPKRLSGPEKYLTVEISSDNGNTWTELDRVQGPAREKNFQPVRYDLTPYLSDSLTLRLLSSNTFGRRDRVNFDNIQIGFGGEPAPQPGPPEPNVFPDTLNLPDVWAMGLTGEGISVAVVDSGIAQDPDFSVSPDWPDSSRIIQQIAFNPEAISPWDNYGHGTHVAGLIAGNGSDSGGLFHGIAPQANLLNLKVNGESGAAYESDVVAALQWIYDNKDLYNIRVVNLSLNSPNEIFYHESPLDAASEILWFNGVVVVTSAGNKGPAGGPNTANAPPANDPFLITVGASDEHATPGREDDSQASFSAHGVTMDGHPKPDLLAPGKDLVSVLSQDSPWGELYPDRLVMGNEYIRLSGTSMSAPLVSGAAALLLQAEPDLTPDQVKYRLLLTSGELAGKPYLDIYAAIVTPTTESANTGIPASQLLWTGDEPVLWESVNWNSVNWNSVNWNSVNWNSVNWNSINWNSLYWEE